MSCLCIRLDNIMICVQGVIREMRISQNIKPPCDLGDIKQSPLTLVKILVQNCVSMIKLDKVLIIEMLSKRLKHLYTFSPPNIRIIKLESESI